MWHTKREDYFAYSKPRHTRGYILPAVVILSIVIFSTILITLQYISATYGSFSGTLRREAAREIANEQLRRAMECADEARDHSGCSITDANTGAVNNFPSKTTTAFNELAGDVEATTTTTVGNPLGPIEQVTVKARAKLEQANFETIEPTLPALDDGERIAGVAAGGRHTCAWTSEGKLYCWGDNTYGQIGDGTATSKNSPQYISTLTNVTSVSAGMYHTCAIAGTESKVYCWGGNAEQQLGRGGSSTATGRTPATTSPALTGVSVISAGGWYSCASTTSNQLYCWGRNREKQLGTGNNTPSRIGVPTRMLHTDVVGKVKQVSAGMAHTCIVRSTDSQVYCWGLSEQGAAGGFGFNATFGYPIYIQYGEGGKQYKSVSAGHWHTCAIDINNRLKCWGYNHNGQLGASRPWYNIWGPGFVNTPPATASAVDSYAHNCAVASGDVYCWGNPSNRRLGNNGSTVWKPYRVSSLSRATAVAAGDMHSCAVVTNGKALRCWGNNTYGQLGNGAPSITNTSTPQDVGISLSHGSGASAFTMDSIVTAGFPGGLVGTCALKDGDVYCWGEHVDRTSRSRPMKINLGSRQAVQVEVSAGMSACALLEDGAVRCWGINMFGQLGNGEKDTSPSPAFISTDVANLGGKVVQIAAGGFFSCALLENGTVKCWGNNESGQLGVMGATEHLSPVTVSALGEKAVQIKASYMHSCAILESGDTKCWGNNESGQLGIGNTASPQLPSKVQGLSGQKITQISLGMMHTCAILENGQGRCWGENAGGQIGTGSYGGNITLPTPINGLTDTLKSISGGYMHSCAVLETGHAKCWGNNATAQLGVSGDNIFTPTTVTGLSNGVHQISAGLYNTCALLENGQGRCWGYNYSGALGDGTNQAVRPMPTAVVPPLEPEHTVIAAGNHSCAINPDRQTYCWGNNTNGQLGDSSTTSRNRPVSAQLPSDQETLQVVTGTDHTCTLMDTAKVYCWGANNYGQLGTGDTVQRNEPTLINVDNKSINHISTGSTHTCAVTTAGEVYCWGLNGNRQLGITDTASSKSSPVKVNLGSRSAIQVAAGSLHTCALLDTKAVVCWGSNSSGRLGNGSTSTPAAGTIINVSLPAGKDASSISAGASHTCAIVNEGEVFCWGPNTYGGVGDGTTASKRSPVPVLGLLQNKRVNQISVGHYHTCATVIEGDSFCWGYNNNGQLGDGTNTHSSSPVAVLGIKASQISAGRGQSCAIVNRQAYCWGSNTNGGIGDGTTIGKNTPTAVRIERIDYSNYLVF